MTKAIMCRVERKKMSEKRAITGGMQVEEYLQTKKAIQLPQDERLKLLVTARYYPLSGKRTSAYAQIKEMIDLYDFYSYMLGIPDDKCQNDIILQAISRAIQETGGLEEKICAIKDFFYRCSQSFPDFYDKFGLEDLMLERVTDIEEASSELFYEIPEWTEKIKKRWNLS